MEDVFGEDEKVISEQEYKKIQTKFEKEGYREGITATNDENLQSGFDCGFREGAVVGFHLGCLHSALK
jgi:hypothetical protein